MWHAGRAAQRLTETSGRQATTIHRLLQWVPQRTQGSGSSDATQGNQYSSDTSGRFKFNARYISATLRCLRVVVAAAATMQCLKLLVSVAV